MSHNKADKSIEKLTPDRTVVNNNYRLVTYCSYENLDVPEKEKTITTLMCMGFQLRNEEAKHIAHTLRFNLTITELNLEGCLIGSKGIQNLFDALRQNTTLVTLNLDANAIHDDATLFLAEACVGIRLG
ncbi:hypothetical protein I4U23_005604 [Adineta vaga]|nr:hypothetical protein I4U23_005604 [Adineta vaga]